MMRRRQLIALGLPLFVFWLSMWLLLWQREAFSPHSNLEPALSAPRAESWMGIYVGDRQRVGRLHFRRTPATLEGSKGSRTSLDARLRLTLAGELTELEVSGSTWRALDGKNASFDFNLRSGDYDARLEGGVKDEKLEAVLLSAGERIPLALPLEGPWLLSSGLGATLEMPKLAVGEETRVASFDPLTLQRTKVRIRCLREESLVLTDGVVSSHLLQVDSGSLRSRVWVDSEGEVVRAETPLGLTLERISPREILEAGETPGEILALSAVHPKGETPFRGARQATVRLGGLEPRALLAIPRDGAQQPIGEDRLRIEAPDEPSELEPSPAPEGHLEGTAFVQADHPRIREQAALIVGDEQHPWTKTRQVHDWVFEHIAKEPALSIPSALEVLDQRRGDCNEHTVLFTALARAAGIPTRIAIGVVWSDVYAGFYYHAWPEVWIDGWISVDPTLGQPIADATHVKLLNGGIEAWPGLVSYLGQLEIEVLEIH